MNIKRFVSKPSHRRVIYNILFLLVSFVVIVSIINHLQRPDAEQIAAYQRQLQHSESEKRIEALLGLGRTEAIEAVSEVEAVFLKDRDERVRRAAAYAILEIDRRRFYTLLEGADEASRLLALETLARRERGRATRYLVEGMEDDSAAYRLMSLEMLARFGDRRADEMLNEIALDETRPLEKRLAATRAIGQRAGRNALETLENLSAEAGEEELREAARSAASAARQKR